MDAEKAMTDAVERPAYGLMSGFLKSIQQRFIAWEKQAVVRKPRPKRPYSSRYYAEQQRIRWGEDDVSTGRGDDEPDRSGFADEILLKKRLLPPLRFADPRSLALTVLPVVLGLGAVLVFVLVNFSGTEQPQPATPPRTPPADPLASYSDSVKTELLAARTQVPAKLKLIFSGKPEELCQELTLLGMENSGWRRAPFSRNRWQCDSDLVPLTTASVDYGPSTLFFLLRGPDQATVDYLRLKLNVEDPKQMEIGQEAVRLVIGALSDRYSWDVPERFLNAITGFQALEMTDRGVRLSVAPEDPDLTGDPTASQRLNIVLDFGKPDLIRSPEKFERLPVKRKPVRLPAVE